jgi:tRNA/rRNA methyltransferase
MDPVKPVIILVQTQLATNIGMCARAMLNCGLEELRLVAPRDGWPNADAIAPATDAKRVVERAKVFATVEEAVADCHRVYATTARIRHLNTPVVTATEAAREIHDTSAASLGKSRPAILFGPEASGLDNDSISRADRLVHFPMNPEFTSLNLAQAVLIFSWEWWSSRDDAIISYENDWEIAPRSELDQYLSRLEAELKSSSFFTSPEKQFSMMQKIRTIYSRSNPSSQELKCLQGIITALISERR